MGTKLIKISITLCVFLFIFPLSAFASSPTTISSPSHRFFQNFCTFFSFHSKETQSETWSESSYNKDYSNYTYTDKHYNSYDQQQKTDLWHKFITWCSYKNSGATETTDNSDESGGCDNNIKSGSSGGDINNDNGKTTSADCWKLWYGVK